MVGGKIIENVPVTLFDETLARRIWCVNQYGDECAVYADTEAAILKCGEEIWWQNKDIMARNDTLKFHKYGNSFDPTRMDQSKIGE